MKHVNLQPQARLLALLLLIGGFVSHSYAEEPSTSVQATPVFRAEPVAQNKGVGKLFGKTMKTVSHSGRRIFPKFSATKSSTDKGAPSVEPAKLFDSNQSPIRTARLFSIKINPPVATPVE